MRKRAEWRTPIQHTHRQDTPLEIGQKMADKANRDGVAERCLEPAVQKRSAVDLVLMDHDARLLRDRALDLFKTAKPHDATTLDRRHTVPGIGDSLRWVLLDERPDRRRCPR